MEIKPTSSLPYYMSEHKNGEFKLIGRSTDESVSDYYCTIIDDIKNYNKSKNISFHIDMDYYNTRTSIYLKDIFNVLKQFNNNGIDVVVNWYYYVDDTDMVECGQDYSDLIGLNFNIIKKDKFTNII
jgi:hypothetical protein